MTGNVRGSPGLRASLALLATVALAAALILFAPDAAYPWIKSFHIISVIAWMAAMLYLPRLFVYHAQAGPNSAAAATFKVMEGRLLRAIMNPAMVGTWVFGAWLAWRMFALQGGWLHAKLALVFVLSGLHGYYSAAVRRFAEGRETRGARHWRIMNEVPALLMVAIVILVVVKPF